jgi:Tfp pilus assembly PilM family ATPase
MPRILAIDWDRLEARALLVHSGPTGTSIAGAWSVSLAVADGATPAPREIGSKLGGAIGNTISANVTTLVGVGRDQVQMVLLNLPPAPPAELPDLVRFQAERELTSLGPDAALDYIPLSGDATTPHQVLAAALSAGGITEVRQLCEAVGVEPARITLRATAAASFVARRLGVNPNEVLLVVNRLTDEADLTVIADDHAVLIRTVRLPIPSETVGRARALAGEIRRTIAAVRQQLGERQLSRVVLCGIAAEAGDAASLASDLKLPVEVFDVADNAPAGLAKTGLPPENLARFAAVMGMALGEADRREPVVDFLNVRRRTTERKFTRQHALAAAAAALVLLSFLFVLWKRSHDLSSEIARLNAATAAKQTEFKTLKFDQTLAQAESVEKWLATDVNWLDELDRLSQQWRPETLDSKKYPVADDAVISQLVAFRPPGNESVGGRIAVQAVARSPQVVATLEARLRDKAHLVQPGGGRMDNSVPGYLWAFPLTIDVVPVADDIPAADDAEAAP